MRPGGSGTRAWGRSPQETRGSASRPAAQNRRKVVMVISKKSNASPYDSGAMNSSTSHPVLRGIRNARVRVGATPPRPADIAFEGDRIEAILPAGSLATDTIDAEGRPVEPGTSTRTRTVSRWTDEARSTGGEKSRRVRTSDHGARLAASRRHGCRRSAGTRRTGAGNDPPPSGCVVRKVAPRSATGWITTPAWSTRRSWTG